MLVAGLMSLEMIYNIGKDLFYCLVCNFWKVVRPNSGMCLNCCLEQENGWDELLDEVFPAEIEVLDFV